MESLEVFTSLGIAMGLGLLVGMQKERSQSRIAGVRTFALISLLGAVCALLNEPLGSWVIVAGFVSLAACVGVANLIKMRDGEIDAGMTTEVAALLMFVVGAYVVLGHRQVAVALGGVVAVLLFVKPMLHGFVRRLGDDDMKGMMQFVLITLVILPVLPDQPYGPFQVLNPRQIWWMVVLVVGISFGGYIALKLFGHHAGVILSGILGGASSTATTVSQAREAASTKSNISASALIIMLASSVLYVRVLVEIAIVARSHLLSIGLPVAVLLGLGILQCMVMLISRSSEVTQRPARDNPTELKSAILFGAMYAAVLFAVAAGKHYFDDRGLYVIAAISGLTDMDAITLSTARMTGEGELDAAAASARILIGTIANLAFKAALVAVLGTRGLFLRVLIAFGIQIAAAIALLFLWPGEAFHP